MRTNIASRGLAHCGALTFLFLGLAMAAPVSAQTTRYVSSSGSDTGDCSNSGTPCQSVGYAIGVAVSGDEVEVGPGTYAPFVVNKSVTLSGISNPVVSVGPNQTGVSIAANGVTFQGFRVAGPHTGSYLTQNWNDGSTQQTFGIALQPGVTGAVVQNNVIEHVRSGVQGLGSASGTILNNTVDNTKGAILTRTGDFVVSGNQEGEQGNEWGIVVLSSLAPATPVAINFLPLQAEEGYDEAVMALSADNGGMSVLDRRFAEGNTSHAYVAEGASPGPEDDFGIGNGLGNPRQPFGAIQHGLTSVVEGGSITVTPGTYTESTVCPYPMCGGNPTMGLLVDKNRVSIRAVDENGQLLDAKSNPLVKVRAGGKTDFSALHIVAADGVLMEGLSFERGSITGYFKAVEVMGDELTFRNNVVDNTGVTGTSTLYFGVNGNVRDAAINPHASGSVNQFWIEDNRFIAGEVTFGGGVGIQHSYPSGNTPVWVEGHPLVEGTERVFQGNEITPADGETQAHGLMFSGYMPAWWDANAFTVSTGPVDVLGNNFASGFTSPVRIDGGASPESPTAALLDLVDVLGDNTFGNAVLTTTDAAGLSVRAGEGMLGERPFVHFAIDGTIAAGISRAQEGDYVIVHPGVYPGNVVLNKAAHLIADKGLGGNGVVTVSGTSGSRITVTAGGSEIAPLRIEGFQLTGSGNGVNFQGTVSHVNLADLDVAVSSSGVNFTSSGVYSDIEITGSTFDGGTRGIFANNMSLNGFSLSNSEVTGASTHGIFLGNASGATAPGNITNVTIEDSHFESNGGSDDGNGDVSLYYFNGDAVLRNITIQGHTDATIDDSNGASIFGIQIRGLNSIGDAGEITLDNVAVTGFYHSDNPAFNPTGIYIQGFADVSGISFSNVSVNIGSGVALGASGLTNVLDLGDTSLETADPVRPLLAVGTNVQNPVPTYMDATGSTLGGIAAATATSNQISDLYDRMIDGTKVAGLGAIYLQPSTLFVGPDSFVAPETEVDLENVLTAARSGDTVSLAAGTYSGNLTLSKPLTLQGQGETTVLQGTFLSDNGIVGTVDAWAATPDAASIDNASGRGISISGDAVTVSDLKIVGYQSGLEFTGSDMANAVLSDVVFENNYTGIRKGTAPSVSGVEMTNVTFRNGVTGIAVYTTSGGGGQFDDVHLDGATFVDLSFKGIYVEALSNALLEDLTFTNVGQFGQPGADPGKFGNGIDINLKHASFTNVVIVEFDMTNVGLSNGAGSPHLGGAAITVKARNDAPSYSAVPASFVGTLIIRDGTISGTSTGIRVGEPGKAVSGPATRVENVTIASFTESAEHGMIDNVSTGLLAFELPDGVSTFAVPPTSTGPFRFTTQTGALALTGGPSNDVALVSGALAANTVANPSAGVYEVSGPGGTKTFTSIEFIQFDDQLKFLADINFGEVTVGDIENIVNTVAQNTDPEAEPAPVILELDTVENLVNLITAIENITPPTPSTPDAPPVVIQIEIPEAGASPQEIEALSLSIPEGVKLVINLGGNTVVAGSPAVVVSSGVVEVANGTISQTSTDHPAIWVETGGGVILNGVTVVESAISENVAILVEPGGQLLVNTAAINIINTVGAGSFVEYEATDDVDLSSVIFQRDGVAVTDPFTIEENVWHFVDDAGETAGFVTWVANQAFAPYHTDVASVARAFDAVPSDGTVNIRGTSFDDALDLGSYGKKIIFVSNGGNDTVTGGGNTDAVMVDGTSSNYTVTNNGGGSFTVVDNRPPGRTLTLQDIEFLAFEGGAYLNLAGTPPPVGQSLPSELEAFPTIVNPDQTTTLSAELATAGQWATFVITQGATDIVLASVQDNGAGDDDPAPGFVEYALDASSLIPSTVNSVRLYETNAQIPNAAGLTGFNVAFTVNAQVEVVPVPATYGSVDSDPNLLSPVDAAYILQFVVQLRSFTSAQRNSADVSLDGFVNSFDASNVLSKILNPAFCMPVENCPPSKEALARGQFEWRRAADEQGAWMELVLIGSAGVRSMDIEIEGMDGVIGAQPVVPMDWMSASHAKDGVLRVSFAGTAATADGIVLRIPINEMNDLGKMNLAKVVLNGVDLAAEAQVNTSLEDDATLPTEYALGQNYPNPFNPATELRFELPESAHVTLEVYNILGIRVALLIDAERQAGSHTVRFDASRLASGTYIYKLTAGRFTTTRKMMLIK